MKAIAVLVATFGVVVGDIVTPYGTFSTAPASAADREWLRSRQVGTPREAFPPGFNFMYVSQDGHIVPDTKPTTGHYIQVIGSPGVAKDALRVVLDAYAHAKKNQIWEMTSY